MTPAPVASNPVLRMTLVVGGIVNAILAVAAGIIGFMIAETNGLISGVVGVLFGFVFLAITAVSILVVNRWNGDPIYPTLFYAVVLGGWLVKFVIFLVGFFLIRDQPWMHVQIFYFSLVATVLASLIVDVVVMRKMRIPIEVALPENVEEFEVAPTDDAKRSGGEESGEQKASSN